MQLWHRLVLVGAVLAVAAAGSAWAGWQWLQHQLDTPLSLEVPMSVDVQQGDTVLSIAQQWVAADALGSTRPLKIAARLQPELADIQAGRYTITPGLTLREALARVREGNIDYERITLIEGWTAAQAVAAVQAHPEINNDLTISPAVRADGAPFLGPAELALLAEQLGIASPSAEGWLYPDTYQFPAGSDASEVLRLAAAGMHRALDDAWTNRAADNPLTDEYQLLVLASIVEKESGVDDERGQIAGVFARRLDLGMRLQTDPTVIYGIGQAYDGDIRRRDLNTTTPWNTYRIDGLPPTPIALPGGASLRAAAAPEPGKSLFFVATGAGDGRHVFSETREAHEKAVQAYLQRQRQP